MKAQPNPADCLRDQLAVGEPDPRTSMFVGQVPPSLAGLLRYAIDRGWVRNEGFRRWHAAARDRARGRRSMEAIQTMLKQQLDRIEIDETAPLEITPEDQRWDLVGLLRRSMPYKRNKLAHGGAYLTRQVRGSLELVAEILGQLFPASSEGVQP